MRWTERESNPPTETSNQPPRCTGTRPWACHTQHVTEKQRRTNEKPIKLPDDFDQTLRDLLATGPTPKDDSDSDEG